MITEEQRLKRKFHIGSSDVAAILGLSPWGSAADVWASKVYPETPDSAANTAMKRGIRLEPLILDQAERDLGPIERDKTVTGEWPVMEANLDGWHASTNTVVEVKTTHSFGPEWGEEGDDALPDNYIVQVMHQMYCCGPQCMKAMVYAAMPNLRTGEYDLRIYSVVRDNDLIDHIVRECRTFWESYVVAKVKPEAEPKSLRVWNSVSRRPGAEALIPQELLQAYHASRRAIREEEKLCEQLRTRILACMGDAEVGICANRVAVSTRMRHSLDVNRIASELPDVYAKYTVPRSYIFIAPEKKS